MHRHGLKKIHIEKCQNQEKNEKFKERKKDKKSVNLENNYMLCIIIST